MRFFVFCLSAILFFSCTKDEPIKIEENAIPENFELVVESISSHSALLKWSDASSTNGDTVFYNEVI